MNVQQLYELWLDKVTDAELLAELKNAAGNPEDINDRFYQSLVFGTGGLRGVIGAGTNRINIYTVGLATQALAAWVKQNGGGTVAIGHDSRNKSDVLARAAAAVLANNGVKTYIYSELEPTPLVSWAVRELHCIAGIVITASHNPAKYNGFKCYGSDGYQMTDEKAHEVEALMNGLDMFADVKHGDFDALLSAGTIEYIDQSVIERFLDAVQTQSINPDACRKAQLKVIYTPLNGAGNKPVRAILKRIGVDDVTVVPSQELPDGNFPTCPKPNPEIRAAFNEALALTKTCPAELLLATDPDCDRVGIAVRDRNGEYKLMSGNEVGIIMLNYILSQRKEKGTLPERPVVVKTIVTSDMARTIANEYGCDFRNVLTGFKYIGEQATILERAGEVNRFVLGYEESYGYCAGAHVRDKDAVVAAMMVCEMASFYKLQGKNLLEVMDELYKKYGYYCHRLSGAELEGEDGKKRIAAIMDNLRTSAPAQIAGVNVVMRRDYLTSVETDCVTGATAELTLPKSNVLEFIMEDKSVFIARPSGTEPKIKYYLTAVAESREAGEIRLDALDSFGAEMLK